MIHNVFINNRVKQLKLKLIHKIVATNENLVKWKLKQSPNCEHCNEIETLQHFFLQCPYVQPIWISMHLILKKLGIDHKFGMFEIIVGYKVQYRAYEDLNIILSQIVYVSYKTYFMTERRTKGININRILYNDMLNLVKYFDFKKSVHNFINKFCNALKEIL